MFFCEMNNIIVSFIVPVYKVEAFLNTCVESIVHQFKDDNMEIILVDDGSPDSCPSICDEWVRKDNRIKVIHKVNGGLSDARNAGLEKARGEYVWFVDSDDWLKSDAIEILLASMNKYPNADVYSTALSYYLNGTFQKQDFVIPQDESLMSGEEYVNRNLLTGASQRFVIRRSLLIENNLRYIKGIIHEDGPFGFVLMYYAQVVVVLPQSVYCYRQREGSIMHSLTVRTSYDCMKIHKYLMAFSEEIKDVEKRKWFMILSSKALLSSYTFVPHLFGTSIFKEFEKNNRRYIQKELMKVIPFLKMKMKMKYLLICIAPKTTIRFLRYRGSKKNKVII